MSRHRGAAPCRARQTSAARAAAVPPGADHLFLLLGRAAGVVNHLVEAPDLGRYSGAGPARALKSVPFASDRVDGLANPPGPRQRGS